MKATYTYIYEAVNDTLYVVYISNGAERHEIGLLVGSELAGWDTDREFGRRAGFNVHGSTLAEAQERIEGYNEARVWHRISK